MEDFEGEQIPQTRILSFLSSNNNYHTVVIKKSCARRWSIGFLGQALGISCDVVFHGEPNHYKKFNPYSFKPSGGSLMAISWDLVCTHISHGFDSPLRTKLSLLGQSALGLGLRSKWFTWWAITDDWSTPWH